MTKQRGRPRSKQLKETPFAKRLIELRKASGYTQEELAEKAGLTSSYISQLESGYKAPTPQKIRALAGPLDVPAIVLKSAAGLVEFWDLFPPDTMPTTSEVLSSANDDEKVVLLLCLHYLRKKPSL